MAESTILGPDGRPIRKKELTREIAAASVTGVRQVWNADSMADGLTPYRLATILRSAAEGDHHDYLTLAEEMEERNLHYAAVLGTRKRAVSGLLPSVEAASDAAGDVKLADAVRELVRRPEFGEMLDDCLDAIGKGYAAVEILWDRSGREWWPKTYRWRDPRFFTFDRDNGRILRLLDETDSFNGIALPAYKFIVHMPRLKSGLPIRRGLARLVAAAYMCKAYALTDWVAFAEVFGMPLRIGRYGPTATERDIQTLINAVANLGTDAAAVLPDSMRIEFEESGQAKGGETLFQALAEWLDKQTSKAVLGQTMTADDGSSQSQAQVHDSVREDILDADARQLQNTLNRDLVKPFIDLNFGPQERYPQLQLPVPQPEDLKVLADVLEKMVPLGLGVEQAWARDKFGVPDPDEGAELLSAPGSDGDTGTAEETGANMARTAGMRREGRTPGAVWACGTALNRANSTDDTLDDIEAEALQDWEQQMGPVVDPVLQLAEKAESFEEFVNGLPALLDQMDSGELIRQLALATFKARGAGDAEG